MLEVKHECDDLEHDDFFGGGSWTCTCGATGKSDKASTEALVNEFLAHVLAPGDCTREGCGRPKHEHEMGGVFCP
jgi:hypothetical protein